MQLVSFPPGTKCHHCGKETAEGIVRNASPPQVRIHVCEACDEEHYNPKGVYDSTADTLAHIEEVRGLLKQVINSLSIRADTHDQTKLEGPEKPYFDKFTPRLKGTTYGSDEYNKNLEGMQVGLKHHYEANRHHPEHFPNGINDMTLIDLIELFCDWVAATRRHDDGDIHRSIDQNEERFAYSSQLTRIFQNTAFANPDVSKFGARSERPKEDDDTVVSIECFIDGMRRMTHKLKQKEALDFRATARHLDKYLTEAYDLPLNDLPLNDE